MAPPIAIMDVTEAEADTAQGGGSAESGGNGQSDSNPKPPEVAA